MLCTYVVRRWLRLSAARHVVKLTPQQVSRESPDRPADLSPTGNRLKVECLLTLAIWSYGHEAEEYIFLNLPFPSNPKENSSIRCILSTPEQNLL